jgi:hypothetical protein
MNKNRIVMVLLLFVMVGLGYGLAYVVQTYPLLAPAGHAQIAANIKATDVAAGSSLTVDYMGGVFDISMPSLNEFPPGHNYAYSHWKLDLNGQAEGFIVIAGPAVDGKTYGIEVSRKCWDELKITMPEGTVFDFPAVSTVGAVSAGYVSFEFVPNF